MKRVVVLGVLFIILVGAVSAGRVTSGSCNAGEKVVLELVDENNSHVFDPGTGKSHRLCMEDFFDYYLGASRPAGYTDVLAVTSLHDDPSFGAHVGNVTSYPAATHNLSLLYTGSKNISNVVFADSCSGPGCRFLLSLEKVANSHAGNETWGSAGKVYVNLSFETNITTDPAPWYSGDFDVGVEESYSPSDPDTNCEYRVDDGNDGDFSDPGDTPWTARTCNDPASFTLTADSGGECSAEGTDACRVQVRIYDSDGVEARDTEAFNIDYSSPGITCDECDSPDPVRSGNDINFDPQISDAGSGVSSVEICEDSSCSSLYCSGDPCSYETNNGQPGKYGVEPYWINATDVAGNSETTRAFNFTVKKWVGTSCTADRECLLGGCEEGVCMAERIPPPRIILTSYAGGASNESVSLGAGGPISTLLSLFSFS